MITLQKTKNETTADRARRGKYCSHCTPDGVVISDSMAVTITHAEGCEHHAHLVGKARKAATR